MANKTLKSIKFPDLADTYVIPQVDSTLAISGRPADSKSTGDALALKADASALSDYAKTDGLYEDMTVGNAEQLVASVFEEDSTPYLFRTSGGSVDIGDREYINGIVGGTVAWNQRLSALESGNYDTNGATVSYSSGVATCTATVATVSGIYLKSAKRFSITGHKYFISGTINSQQARRFKVGFDDQNDFAVVIGSGDVNKNINFASIRQATADNKALSFYRLADNGAAVDDIFAISNYMCLDLTQMFGSTIADYIYSLESGTAGAGVAWFKKLFPSPYYAYNAGELKSVSGLVSHDMTGFNQWDEEWELGTYNMSTGESTASNYNIRGKNRIRVAPNTKYYGNNTYIRWLYFDADDNFISSEYGGGRVITTPINCYYLRVFFGDSYGTTYKNDICINLSWDGSRDGEYEPYELHSYPLDTDLTLRGIPKLDANNSLYYDGDTYEADGTVTRKYASIDLGSLSWYKESDGIFYAYINDRNQSVSIGSICSKYTWSGGNTGFPSDKTYNWLQYHDVQNIYITDSAYTDAATFKTAMSGVYLVYELATPTTETADAYQNPQIVNDFGTEEFVLNNSIVPVGHETKYQANLVAKLEMMPNSPSGNGDYIVRQTSGENSYVAITDNSVIDGLLTRCPAASGEDGTYVLKATISDDTVTYAWVAE